MDRITQQGQTGGQKVAEKSVRLKYNAASNFDEITRYANLAETIMAVKTD